MVIAGNDPFLAILACATLGGCRYSQQRDYKPAAHIRRCSNFGRIPYIMDFRCCTMGVALTFGYHLSFQCLARAGASTSDIHHITVAILAVVHVFMKHTRTGSRMYAAGGNPAAARNKLKRCMFVAFFIAEKHSPWFGRCAAGGIWPSRPPALSTGHGRAHQRAGCSSEVYNFSRTGLSVIKTAISAHVHCALSNGTDNKQEYLNQRSSTEPLG